MTEIVTTKIKELNEVNNDIQEVMTRRDTQMKLLWEQITGLRRQADELQKEYNEAGKIYTILEGIKDANSREIREWEAVLDRVPRK